MPSEPAPVEESFEMNLHWITATIRVYSPIFASIRGLNTSLPPRTSFVVEPTKHGHLAIDALLLSAVHFIRDSSSRSADGFAVQNSKSQGRLHECRSISTRSHFFW